MQRYDVVIIGGGMTGVSLALGLSESSLRIAVIDQQSLSAEGVASGSTYSSRVSALTYATVALFKRYGVWELMRDQRVCPYRYIQVWDGEGTGEVSFDADTVGQPYLGHIVENTVIRQALLQKLAESDVELIDNQRQLDFAVEDEGYSIAMADGQIIRARLLIAADGAESRLRQWAGIPLASKDCLHHAIVTTVVTELPHQDTAWQVFLDSGPLAFLPLPDQGDKHYCSIVWSLLPEQANSTIQLAEPEFCKALERAIENKLGQVSLADQRYRCPLKHRHAQQYFRNGIVLVGDAAHTIHPLAGQGVNLGLQDVEVLAEELLRAKDRNDDIGGDHILQRYQRRRKSPNLTMQTAMNVFQHLFDANDLSIRWLRNTGMNLTNRSPLIKQQLIAKAMGLQS